MKPERHEILRFRRIGQDTMPAMDGAKRPVKKGASNADIVRAVLDCYAKYKSQAAPFAVAAFRHSDPRQSVAMIWQFLKYGIDYRLDPDGHQWVKSPSATFWSGFADCKALSTFAASLLRGLGIGHSFRFASYSPDPTPTHVYIIAHLSGGRNVPLDAVYTREGAEKKFTFYQDYNMDIHEISGPKGAMRGKIALVPDGKDLFSISDGEMTARIHAQRLKLKQQKVIALRGIGSTAAARLQDQIDLAEDIVANWDDNESLSIVLDQQAEGQYSASVSGIGRTAAAKKRKEDKQIRKAEKKTTNASKDKPLKKVVEKLKKAAGAAIKVVTAVPRLAMKGLLEIALPKMGPAFLYIFINQPALINAMPPKARVKRDKQLKIFNFITEGIGMKPEHVKGILRNSVIEKFGKDPEKVIAEQLGGKVAGIGFLDDVLEIVIKIIKKIAEGKKDKNAPDFGKDDMPDFASDFGTPGSQQALTLAKGIKAQPMPEDGAGDYDDDDAEDDGGGGDGSRKTLPTKRGIC